ncbi:fimbrial protein [Vogesella amnigena]|uniref:Fimbrial protein n=1 Tax=Vogesella amnigena TaxID=1507449 RepID=A0ABV7TRX5_9NEIS
MAWIKFLFEIDRTIFKSLPLQANKRLAYFRKAVKIPSSIRYVIAMKLSVKTLVQHLLTTGSPTPAPSSARVCWRVPSSQPLRARRSQRWLAIPLALLAYTGAANAGCSNIGGIYPGVTINVPASLSIPRDKANGLLWQSPRLGNSTVNTIECTPTASDYEWGLVTGGPLSGATAQSGYPGGLPTIYNTNIPGIGIAIMFYDNAASPSTTIAKPVYTTAQKTYWNQITGTYFRNSADFQVSLYKTGPITPGLLSLSGTVAEVWYGGNNAPNGSGGVLSAKMFISNDVNITTLTCAISNPNVTVVLPKVANTALPAADTAAGITPFDINMVCNNTKVSYRVDGNQYDAGYTSLIRPTGTAQGVAVQLLTRQSSPTVPLPLGTKKLLTDTTGSSYVPVKLPLATRYYRPSGAPALQPGTVSATATLTMFYE